MELPTERVWADYFLPLPSLSPERITTIAEELAFYYDTHFMTRSLRPDVHRMLETLRARSFRLGVISNVISRTQVPRNLDLYGLTPFFETVVTSSCLGWRKPNPRIFLEATRQLNLLPAECAYVGDTVSRDVVGARRAGYGLVIQIKSFLTTRSDRETDVEPPDAVIQDLMQVVDILTLSLEQRK